MCVFYCCVAFCQLLLNDYCIVLYKKSWIHFHVGFKVRTFHVWMVKNCLIAHHETISFQNFMKPIKNSLNTEKRTNVADLVLPRVTRSTSRLDKDCGLLHPTIYSFLLSDCLLLDVAPSLSLALAYGTSYLRCRCHLSTVSSHLQKTT